MTLDQEKLKHLTEYLRLKNSLGQLIQIINMSKSIFGHNWNPSEVMESLAQVSRNLWEVTHQLKNE